MSTVEGVQYRGGYHPLKFEYRGGCSNNILTFDCGVVK